MMVVLYTILQSTTLTGAVYNYAANEDIEAVLMVRDALVTVHVKDKLMGGNDETKSVPADHWPPVGFRGAFKRGRGLRPLSTIH